MQMKSRKISFLAWTIFVIVTTSALIQTGMTLAKRATKAYSYTDILLLGVAIPLFAFVAALIVSRQPHNLIGWLLMLPAISMAIPAGSFVNSFATPPARPGLTLLLALWFSNWSWLLLIVPILFIPLLYPTGRLPSARWRWVAFAGLIMCLLFIVFSTFLAVLGPSSGNPQRNWTVPNPIGFLPQNAFPIQAWAVLLGVFTVLSAVSLAVRYHRASAMERTQIKWLLFACMTFVVIYVPLLIFNVQNTAANDLLDIIFPLSLMTIPVAIALAILRYHLWDIDIIIRKTLVYVPLTAILTGVFAACIRITQTFFSALVKTQSDAATVLTTLIVVALFDPIKKWLQTIVDAWFNEASNPQKQWQAYGEQVRIFVQMNDPVAIVSRLLEEAVRAFDTKGGAVFLQKSREMQQVSTIGDWKNNADISIPLDHKGLLLGQLSLTARRNGRPFDVHDREILMQNVNAVSAAIALSQSGTSKK
jgi:hypothetical protein